jgi:hypothetical protein
MLLAFALGKTKQDGVNKRKQKCISGKKSW